MTNPFLFQMKAQEPIGNLFQPFHQLPAVYKTFEEKITSKEACGVFRISKTTLQNWKAKGYIPYHRQGRRIYFFRSDLIASLERARHFNVRRTR